jgi:hypothetical protein
MMTRKKMSNIFKTESIPIVDKEYLSDIAQNLWQLQSFQRSVRMFLSEVKRPLTGIDKNLAYQVEELMKAIKRGFVVEDEINEANQKITDYRKELVPWLKKILEWAETGVLTFDSYAGTLFEAPPKDDAPDVADKGDTPDLPADLQPRPKVFTTEKAAKPNKGKPATKGKKAK